MGKFVAAGVVAGVGLVLLVVGCILIPVFDDVVYDTVVDAAKYEEGTDGYDNLVNPSSPTYTYFYFFNLTNPEEVMNNGTPVVVEIGPYVYETTKPKQNITFLEDGTQISYRTYPTYVLDLERTVGDPYTDMITNVNFVVLTAAKLLDGAPPSWSEGFVEAVANNSDTVFETYLINDYLWGYLDETLDESGLVEDGRIDSATEGLFYGVNQTLGDEWIVFTGTDEIDRVNELHMWKGENYTSYITQSEPRPRVAPVWNSEFANMLNGTDGTQYKPFLEKDDLIRTFSSDLCRSFNMLYDSEVDVRGINTYRFVIDPQNFADTEENEGFCIPDTSNCLPEGLLNVDRCYEEAPMVASLPHFYEVDPDIQKTIIGMNPVKELHETAIDVEPITGISVQGNKRLQINILIKHWGLFPDTMVDKFDGDGFIMPIFWINEQTEITQTDADDFISEVIEPIDLLEIIQYVVIGVGAFVMLVGLVLFAYFGCTRNRKSWA